LSLGFDGDYYSGSGYTDYGSVRYIHFAQRGQWIVDCRTDKSFTGEIYDVGAGWGHVVKEARALLPAGQKSTVKGIVFSQFEKDQADGEVGLVTGATELIDAENKTFPAMDMAVSWNFLDSLPPANENKITAICNKLVNKATWQVHVLCMTNNDPSADKYIAQGYNIKSLAYWKDKFDAVDVDSGQECFLVNYATGIVHRKTSTGWDTVTGMNIPTSWGRVSN